MDYSNLRLHTSILIIKLLHIYYMHICNTVYIKEEEEEHFTLKKKKKKKTNLNIAENGSRMFYVVLNWLRLCTDVVCGAVFFFQNVLFAQLTINNKYDTFRVAYQHQVSKH